MGNRTVMLTLCLLVIGYLERIRANGIPVFCSNLTTLHSSLVNMCNLLDINILPCDDFYKFACGKYSASKNQRDFPDSFTVTDIEQKNKQQLLDYLNIKANISYQNTVEWYAENLARSLYKSCLNAEKHGLEPLLRLIQKHGGWPVLGKHDLTEKRYVNLTKTIKILTEGLEMKPILSAAFKSLTLRGRKTRQIVLDLPTFFVNIDLLLNASEPKTEPYGKYMLEFTVKLGAKPYWAEMEMHEVLLFEIELAKIYKETHTLDLIFVMPIEKMEKRFPWLIKYVRPLIDPNHIDKLIVFRPYAYFNKLNDLLKNTPNSTIANYIMWRAVLASSAYLSKPFHQSIMTVSGPKAGPAVPPNDNGLQDRCFNYVDRFIPITLDSLYLQLTTAYVYNSGVYIYSMVYEIVNEMIKMIMNSIWMDNNTRIQLLDHIKKMKYYIGTPHFDRKEILRDLAAFNPEVHPDDFLQSILNILQYEQRFPRKWIWPSWKAHSVYFFRNEMFHTPVGQLQWPFFSLGVPASFNFGGLGNNISYGLANVVNSFIAFDNPSANITANRSSLHERVYLKNSKCFLEQYSAMETTFIEGLKSIKLNSFRTIENDISDNLGVKAAYRAFRRHKGEPPFFQPEKLFWISLAQTYCGYTSPSNYLKRINEDNETLPPYRVLGMLRNMPEFANDFNCPKDSYMNTRESLRCEML